MVSQRIDIAGCPKVRSHGLRAEKTKIHEIGVLGSQMIRAGKKVSGRENIIELAEGIDRLRFRYVVGKREGSHRPFVQGVLKAFVKIEAVLPGGVPAGDPTGGNNQ